jgi:hypothetical protein
MLLRFYEEPGKTANRELPLRVALLRPPKHLPKS